MKRKNTEDTRNAQPYKKPCAHVDKVHAAANMSSATNETAGVMKGKFHVYKVSSYSSIIDHSKLVLEFGNTKTLTVILNQRSELAQVRLRESWVSWLT